MKKKFYTLFIITIIINVSCASAARGPKNPPPEQCLEKYENNGFRNYKVKNINEITGCIQKILEQSDFQVLKADFKNDAGFFIKTGYKPHRVQAEDGRIFGLSLFISGEKNFNSGEISVRIYHFLAESCMRCSDWNDRSYYDPDLEIQINEIILNIFNGIQSGCNLYNK